MEALILYFVIFFPGIYSPAWLTEGGQLSSIPFSVYRELGRTLTYALPSLALLLYIISDRKGLSGLKALNKRAIQPFLIALPGLIIIGVSLSVLAGLFAGETAPPRVEGPANFSGWIVMVFSCLATGYLEETYFRHYLLSSLKTAVPNTAVRILFSTALFAFCHMYEGPWAILNAAFAGILLSLLFIRFKSLHGLALAHAGYNIFVYTGIAG